MKIAVVTEDGSAVAPHFGPAPYYIVFTIDGGRITGREQREKPACEHHSGQHHAGSHSHEAEDAGDGPDLHTRMTNVIADCEVVLGRVIPRPMQEHLVQVGIRPVLTQDLAIEEALGALLGSPGST